MALIKIKYTHIINIIVTGSGHQCPISNSIKNAFLDEKLIDDENLVFQALFYLFSRFGL